jgi:hypothetical protein
VDVGGAAEVTPVLLLSVLCVFATTGALLWASSLIGAAAGAGVGVSIVAAA